MHSFLDEEEIELSKINSTGADVIRVTGFNSIPLVDEIAHAEKWHSYLDDQGNFFYYLRTEHIEKEKDHIIAYYNTRDVSE